MKSYILVFLLMHGVDADTVTVMEGDPVTLHTDFKTNQRDRIRWYFDDTRIAQITGDLSKICTDVQCNEGTERFRDRLKLDQTGSLTITDTRTTDSGLYHQEAVISGTISEKIFNVTITGNPGPKEMMRRKGSSDISDNGEAETRGFDSRDELPVLSAIRTSAGDQGSAHLGVTVGVTLLLVVAAVGTVVFLHRKSKQKRQDTFNKRKRGDAKLEDGLTQDEERRNLKFGRKI